MYIEVISFTIMPNKPTHIIVNGMWIKCYIRKDNTFHILTVNNVNKRVQIN